MKVDLPFRRERNRNMKLYCGKLVSFLLLGNTVLVKAQPRSPNAPRPITPRKPAAPAPKPVAPVSKPAAPVPKPVPKPAAPASKPALAQVPKPLAPVPKPKPLAPKPVAPVPKPKPLAPKPAAPVPSSGCPTIAPYTKPPAAECVKCYKDMGALATLLNSASGNVSVTLCSGTNAWPTASAAVVNSNITSLKLSCCGNAKSCIIDGGAPNVTRTNPLITVNNPIKNLDIQGITFQNINCTESYFYCDGALLAVSSNALVTFKHITVSKVTSSSGGALVIYSPSLVFLENCTFIDNTATTSFYGGTASCFNSYYSTVLMNGNSFLRNSAFGYGAVSLYSSQAEANCNTFEDGKSNERDYYYGIAGDKIGDASSEYSSIGAAIYLDSSSLDAKLNVFTNNTAGYGGAIYASDSKIHAKSNKFTLNTAMNDGEGATIYLDFSFLDAESNVFTNNRAGDGGAIYAYSSRIHANSNTFSSNAAAYPSSYGGNGAAIYLSRSSLDAKLNAFTNNAANNGGALYGRYSVMVISADTFANNVATTDGDNVYVDYQTLLTTCPNTLTGVFIEDSSLAVVNCS